VKGETIMNIHLRSRNGKVSDRQRAAIEEKLAKLERYTGELGDVTVELARSQQRGTGEVHIVQATLHMPQGTIVRAEERQPDLLAAIDSIHDTLQRQLTRYKDKHYRRGKLRRAESDGVALEELAEPTFAPEVAQDSAQIVRTKRFTYKPMSSEEAIEQMELLGHSFFVFTDADTEQISVVYRRRDGNYGLIVPETA
jgi:ribosomal subunit interface protein